MLPSTWLLFIATWLTGTWLPGTWLPLLFSFMPSVCVEFVSTCIWKLPAGCRLGRSSWIWSSFIRQCCLADMLTVAVIEVLEHFTWLCSWGVN